MRTTRRARLWLLALTAALAAIFAPSPEATAQISLLGLQNSLVQFALRRISTPDELEITAQGVQEGEDGRSELVGVRVADRQGVWLEIDAVRLAWSPTRILRGELEINTLAARGVRVLRRPVGEDVAVTLNEPPPPRPLFSWPRSPINTRIEEVRLDGVTVAAGVLATQSIAFDATGAARDEGNEQAARLTLTRTDAVAGRIGFDYLRDFRANTLRLDLDADEAAGGLAGELAGFPPDSASRLSLEAAGPLTDWRLDFSASADRVFEASGEADVTLAAPVSVAADFSVTPGPAMAEAARAALAPEARLTLRATEDADGVIRIEEGGVRSPELTLDLSGTYARATGALDGAVTLEAEGGLAALTDGLSFTRAGFEGRVQGTFDDLTATGALSLDGLATAPADVGEARLDGTVELAGGRVGFDVTGHADGVRLDRIGPETLGRTALDAGGAWEGGLLTLDRLTIGSPLLTAEASGAADLGAETAALDYRVSAPDLRPIAAAYDADASGAFSASGRLEGPLSGPRLTGEAALSQVAVGGEDWGGVRLTHDATFGGRPQGRVDLTAEGSPLGPARIGTDFLLTPGLVTLSQLSAEALGVTARGTVGVRTGDGLAVGSVAFETADLGAAADRMALRLSGAAQGRITLAAPEGRQDVLLRLDGVRLAGFGATVARLRLDAALRDARGTPSAEGVAEVAGLDHPQARIGSARFEGRATDLTGALAAEGVLTAEAVGAAGFDVGRLRFEGEGSDLLGAGEATGRLEAERITGPDGLSVARAGFTGTARDLTGALSAEGVLTAEEISAAGARLARLRIEGEGSDLTGAGKATARLTAEGAEGFGAAARAVTFEGSARDFTGALAAEGTLSAEGVEAGGARIASVTVEGSGTDLIAAPAGSVSARIGAISGDGIAGAGARLDATLARGPAGARLDATGQIEPLTAGGTRIGLTTFEARVDDALGAAPRIDAALAAGASEIGGAALSGATLTARGPLSALDLTLAADGATREGEALTLDAAAQLDLREPAAPSGTIARFDLAAGEARGALRAPARIASSGGTTRVDGLDLALPGGGLRGDLAIHSNGMAGDLALDLADVGPLAAIAGAPLESGRLAAEARFDTRPGSALADVTVTGRDLVAAFSASRELGGLDLDATGRWNGSRAEVAATLVGPYRQPVTASFEVGLRPSGGPLPELVRGGAVEGRVRWEGRLGDLWAQVPLPDHILDGDADIDLRLSGPIAAPDVSGEVTLRNGRYEYLETGTILTDVEIASRVAPGGAFEITLRALDGADAPVTGFVRLNDGALDARVQASDAVLVRRDDVTAEMTVDVRAAGPLAGPAITGTVEIDRAEVRLVDATPPQVASLGEVRIKGEPPPEPREPAGAGVTLDVRVFADDRIFVRGRGLDSEWRADVAVRGTAAEPVVTGSIDRIRGVLNLIGAVFELERGSVKFTGGQPIDPVIDVALFRENRGVRGGVVVRGPVSDPQIGFESNPPLPESEVLPRVLFGSSQQSLSPGQAVQLALGLATLLDGTGGAIDAARATVGIDVLRFEEEQILGDGEKDKTRQTVTVGSNVADGVFVGATQPIDGGQARVRVEIEVYDNVTVDTEVGAEDQSSVGVNWRHDF